MFRTHHHHHEDPLSPEKMRIFMAGLSGLDPEEVRKAKVLYLRNAISSYRAMKESVEAFRGGGCLFSPFSAFRSGPVKQVMDVQLRLARERIENAIDVRRDDLRGERFEID